MLPFLFLLPFLPVGWCGVPVGSQSVFGHSIKNGHMPLATEVTTFEHTCSIPPCVVTQIHIPAIYPAPWENATLRIYIDGESTAGIVLSLQQLVSEELPTTGTQDGSPWGIPLMGKTAAKGGLYSTVRIPFGTHIKTTLENDANAKKATTYWFIIRGIEAHPVVLGDLILPDTARLHIYKKEKVVLNRFDLITIANISADRAGALLRVQFSSVSNDFTYLEACMRLFVDGKTKPIFLSSGAEDYFLSAFYFDEGMFKTSESGLTYFEKPGSLTAYKHHDRDLIPFSKGLSLVFRNYENTTGCGDLQHCPQQWCGENHSDCTFQNEDSSPHTPQNISELKSDSGSRKPNNVATYSTLVWVYEWPTPSRNSKVDLYKSQKSVALGYVAVMGTRGVLTSNEEEVLFDALLADNDSAIALVIAIKDAKQQQYLRLLDHLKRFLKKQSM